MSPDAPTAHELARICTQCTDPEWSALCRNEAFIEAAGISLERAARVATEFTGREILPEGTNQTKETP